MIARSPEEQQAYESRRKARMDYFAGLDEAFERGFKKGLEQGLEKALEKLLEKDREEGERLVLLDEIRFLQELLQETQATATELQALKLSALRGLCGELRNRVCRAR